MKLAKDIFNISSEEDFKSMALEVFKYQFNHNPVYRAFCDLLYRHPSDISSIEDIPFLPISFFKTGVIITGEDQIEKIFSSSGTTGSVNSKHYVSNLSLYEQSFTAAFSTFYGAPEEYVILGLLPNYLERDGSSLVYMVEHLMTKSHHLKSGFYLYNHQQLNGVIRELEERGRKVLLIGVSFALLDFVEKYPQRLQHTIVMETGGMKGRRKELIRQDLHNILCHGFGVSKIHSEYGMTELMSQAYSKGDGIFSCPPWMKVLSRETEDPLSIQSTDKTGGLNIIDLANINSCSFIATQDLGKVHKNNRFEVMGRFDNSDLRGCNLMAL